MSSRIAERIFGRRSLEDPNTPFTGHELLGALGLQLSDAGISVTPETATRLGAVYRSWSLIGGTIGSLPLGSFRRERGPSGYRLPYDSPVLTNPHPDYTPMELWEYAITSMLGHGNGFVWKARDQLGRIRELWPIHPKRIDVHREKPTDANPSGKVFEVDQPPEGRARGRTNHDLLHLPALSYDGVRGLSPIQHVAAQGVGLALAAEQFGASLFGKGALIPGYLTTEQQLDQDVAEELQQRWAERTAGPANWWKVPVMDRGAKFEPIAIPPKDAQYIEIRKFQVGDIATIYGIPPVMLGQVEKSTSWGTGIEQQTIGFVVYTLRPWLTRVEQRISKELLPVGAYARFNVEGLLRGDIKSRAEYLSKMRQNGVLRGSEIRALEDWAPDAAADEMWRPTNMQAVETAGDTAPEEDPDEDEA